VKALLFRKSIPRYALLKYLGPHWRRLYRTGVAPLSLTDIAPPPLPSDRWVRVTPSLTGICGSDLATICATGSPYLAPVTSMPFVPGHEIVGTISETGSAASRFHAGDRVVLRPALGCHVRGIDDQCPRCRDGLDALCENVTRGDLSPGIQTGFCRDTGGGFSPGFAAHADQLLRVPETISDTMAVLVEPFSCAIHGVLRTWPEEKQTVLIIGCGAIGLLAIAALRGLDCRARIIVVAKYDHQAEHAIALGANEILPAGGDVPSRYRRWAESLSADVLKPELGKPAVIGGADIVYDCVASSTTIDDGLRFTRSGGAYVLVGMPGIPRRVDWTPMWFEELTVLSSYAYGRERHHGNVRDTFEIALELMTTWGDKLARLVGPPHALEDYRAALAAALATGRSGAVKTVITPGNG